MSENENQNLELKSVQGRFGPRKNNKPPMIQPDLEEIRLQWNIERNQSINSNKSKNVLENSEMNEPTNNLKISYQEPIQPIKLKKQQRIRMDKFYRPILKGAKLHKISFRDNIEKENGLVDVKIFQCNKQSKKEDDTCCCTIY